MNRLEKFSLITSLICSTLILKNLDATGCSCPVVYSTDSDVNPSGCWGGSTSGCNSGCDCPTYCSGCDWLGALTTIRNAGNVSGQSLEVCTVINTSTYDCDPDSLGTTITLDPTAGGNTLASSLSLNLGQPFTTGNKAQIITTANNSNNYPVLNFIAGSYSIDSALTFQNSIFWMSNSATLEISGVVNSGQSSYEWSGNTISIDASSAVGLTLNYGPGTYSESYSDTIIVTSGTVTINNSSSETLTLGGPIIDNGTGGSVFFIAGHPINLINETNSYTGTTSLSSGTIGIGASGALSGTNIIWADATLKATASSITIGNGSQSAVISNISSVLDCAGNSFSFDLILSNTQSNVSLTIMDSSTGGFATLTSDSSSYTGAFNLNSGNLVIGSGSNLGSGNVFFTGGSLALGAASNVTTINNTFNLGTSGGINVNGNQATNENYFNFIGSWTNTGSTVGSLLVTNSSIDSGGVTLSGNLLYTGETTISSTEGPVTLSIDLSSGSSWDTSSITIGANGTLELLNALTLPLINPSPQGTLLFSTASTATTVTVDSSIELGTFEVTLEDGVCLQNGGSGSISAGAVNIYGNLLTDLIIMVSSTSAGISTGEISGTGGFNIITGGTLSLSGNNTFSGGISLNSGGTLSASSNSALGSGSVNSDGGTFSAAIDGLSITGSSWVLNGGTTTFNCSAAQGCTLIGLGSIDSGSQNYGIENNSGALLSFTTLENGFNIDAGDGGVQIQSFGLGNNKISLQGTLSITSSTSTSFSGIIEDLSSAGTLNIAGPVTLTGVNSFTGGVILSEGGTLAIYSATGLGSVISPIIGSGGQLNTNAFCLIDNPITFNGGTTTTFSGSMTLEGAVTVASSAGLSSTATLATVGSSTVFNFSSLDIEEGAVFSTNGNNITTGLFGSDTGTLALGATGTPGTTDTITISGNTSFYGTIEDAGNGGVGAVCIVGNVELSPPSAVVGNPFSGGLYIGINQTGTISTGSVTFDSSSALGLGGIYSYGGTLVIESSLNPANDWFLNAQTSSTPQTVFSSIGGGYSLSLGNVSTIGSGSVLFNNQTGNQMYVDSFTIYSGTTLQINAGAGVTVSSLGGTVDALLLSETLTIQSTTSSILSATISDLSPPGALNIDLSSNAYFALTSSANSFSGGVTLTSGTLQITSAGSVPSVNIITAAGGSFVNIGSTQLTISNPFVFVGGKTITFGGALIIDGDISLTGSNQTATIDRTSTTVASQLVLQPSLLAIGANLTLATNGNNIAPVVLSGVGALELGASGITDTLTISSSIGTCDVSILDAGLNAKGAVILTGSANLTGNNTFSGGFTLGSISGSTTTPGTLTVGSSSAIGQSDAVINGGTITLGVASFSFPGNFFLNATGSNPATTIAGVLGGGSLGDVITLLPSGVISGSATLTNTTGSNIAFESLNVVSGTTLVLDASSGGGFILDGEFGSGVGVLQIDGIFTVGSSQSSSFSGVIADMPSGQGTVVIDAALSAPITLAGNNTFSGGLLIENGTLVIGSSTALGVGTINSNGGNISSSLSTLNITNSWVFSATNTSPSPTTTFICSNRGCSVFSLGSASISGASGSIAEIVNNSGTTLSFSTLSIDSGVTLDLNAIAGITVGVLSPSSGVLNLSGLLTVDSTSTFFAGSINDLSGTGFGTLTIEGAVSLTGTNTFSGGIVFNEGGNLSVASTSNLGSVLGTLTGMGGTLRASSVITVSNPWVLTTGTVMNFDGDITLTGPMTISGSNSSTATIAAVSGSVLTLIPSSVNISSGTFATAGYDLTLGASSTFGSGTLALGSATTTDTLTINGASNCSWNIVDAGSGSGAVVVNANVTLSGKNTFTGGIKVNASTVTINSSTALGSGLVTSNGGAFFIGLNNYNPNNTWVADSGSTTTFGCVASTCGSTTLAAFSLGGGAGTATIENATSGVLKFNEISVGNGYTASLITGVNGITFGSFLGDTSGTVEIDGILTFSSGGSYTGAITVPSANSSQLISTIGNTSSLSIGSFVVPSGSTLEVSTGANMSVAFLSGVGTLNIGGSLTINASSSFSFSGVIGDAAASTDVGSIIINPSVNSSVITFAGNNTFSGGLMLSTGTLSVSSVYNLGIGVITGNGGNLTNSTISSITVYNPFTFVGGYTTTIDGSFLVAGSLATTGNGTATLGDNSDLVLQLSDVVLSDVSYPALSLANSTTFATNGHDILLLGSFGSSTGNLMLGGVGSVDTLTINNSSEAVSFSGNIVDANTGGGSLGSVIIATSTTLNGNNSFTGGLTLGVSNASSNQAILTVSNNNALGAGSIIGNGGTLTTSSSFNIDNPWNFFTGTDSSTSFNVSNTTNNQGKIQYQELTIKGDLSTSGGGEAYIYNVGSGDVTVESSSICGTYNVTNTTSTENPLGGILTWNAQATCNLSAAESFSFMATVGDPSPPIVNVVVEAGLFRGVGEITNLTLQTVAGVAPGTKDHPIGTITVADSVSFEDRTIFFAGTDGNSAARIDAFGPVTLSSNANVLTIPVGISKSSFEEVILTAGSITGQFNDLVIIPSIAFLDGQLIYDVPNQVSMKITAVSISQTPIYGENARHVGAALDNAIVYNRENVKFTINCCPPSIDPETPPVLEDLLVSLRPFIGDSDAMSDALDKLHPALFKGLTIVQESNMVQVQKTLEGRTQYLLDTTSCYNVTQEETSCCEKSTKVWDLWADGLGAILHQDSNWSNGSPQVGYQSKMAGFTIGLDAHFAKHFYLGVMGGYTSSFVTFQKSRGTGNIETGYGGAYFSAISDMFYGNISVVGGSNNLSGHRYISYSGVHQKAKHSSMGKQLLSHADTGVNIDVMGWFKVRPFDSFDYITQTEDSYTEKGAGDWNLHVSKKNAIMLRNELGLELSSCLCFTSQKWVISPKASWVREVRVKGESYQASFAQADPIVSLPYTVTGYFPSRNLFSPGLSITGSMCKDLFSVELYYNGEFAHGYSNNAFGGQVRVSF